VLLRHSVALLIALIGLPLLPLLLLLRPRWGSGLHQRLGLVPRQGPGALWLHCASVGEAAVAARLANRLLEDGEAVFVTATTHTGLDTLRRLAPTATSSLAPLDHPWVVIAALRRIQPSALVLIETEIWPALIGAASRRAIPLLVVSGRLSSRSLARYQRWQFLVKPALRRIDRIGARSERDAERFIALGARTGSVSVIGDLKLEPPTRPPQLADDLAHALGHGRCFVAGSTHAGEEAAALAALEHCERHGVACVLVLAPRHLSRVEEVAREVVRHGRRLRHRSALGDERLQPGEVLLLDRLGELAAIYTRASLAFVGGTLAPIGGHNLLEPVQSGCAVCFGPSVGNAEAAAGLLIESGAGYAVEDARALPQIVLGLLSDTELGGRVQAGRAVLEAHRGVLERCVALVAAARKPGVAGAEGAPQRLASASRKPRRPVAGETRLGSAIRSPLRVLAWGYGAAARFHRAAYARGILRARRLPCRVVSVGSLMVGGSGKTPTAAWLARGLQQRGHRVVLATRGYRGRRGEAVRILSDGRQLMKRPADAGDEPMVLARHAPGVPVIVARDRGLAGLRGIAAYDADVVVLDDGFQHHRLQRDLDLLVFDADQPLGNGHVLPRGPLRERPSTLANADAVGLLDGVGSELPEDLLSRCRDRVYCFHGARVPVGLRSLAGDETSDPSVLRGMKVGVLAGIGRPESFVRTLESLGAEVVGRRFLPDHHRYRPRDLRGLRAISEVWITTEKDAVKILPSWLGPLDLRVLSIVVQIADPAALLDFIEEQIDPSATAPRVIGPVN